MQNVKDAANAIAEKVKEVTSSVSFDLHKGTTKNDNLSGGNRTGPITDSPADKVNEKGLGITEDRGVIGNLGDRISNAYHYVAEKVQEAASVVSSDANKEKVKDPNNVVGDKIEEKPH